VERCAASDMGVGGALAFDMLMAGRPEEWRRFEERHGAFLEAIPGIRDAFNVAFKSTWPNSLADAVVLGLARVCAEEFLEILLLCMNGYGVAATKLVRSMYERTVTANYIRLHPDAAERYSAFSKVEKGKLARQWLEQFRDAMPLENVETLERAVAEQREVRDEFPNGRWGPDFVSMAREAKFLWPLIGSCYYAAILHAHPTLHSVEVFIQKRGEDGWAFDFDEPQPLMADQALYHAHTMVLFVLDLQEEVFHPDGLAAAMEAVGEAYKRVWVVAQDEPR
jgi:hypothetical protein